MQAYLISFGAGLLVGGVYAALDVRSPAPPVVALVGLLGILVGEQARPLVRRLRARPASVTPSVVLAGAPVTARSGGSAVRAPLPAGGDLGAADAERPRADRRSDPISSDPSQ